MPYFETLQALKAYRAEKHARIMALPHFNIERMLYVGTLPREYRGSEAS